MLSEVEEIQFSKALRAFEEFVKILVKEYPLVFKDGSGGLKVDSSGQNPSFPYEAVLEIKRKALDH